MSVLEKKFTRRELILGPLSQLINRAQEFKSSLTERVDLPPETPKSILDGLARVAIIFLISVGGKDANQYDFQRYAVRSERHLDDLERFKQLQTEVAKIADHFINLSLKVQTLESEWRGTYRKFDEDDNTYWAEPEGTSGFHSDLSTWLNKLRTISNRFQVLTGSAGDSFNITGSGTQTLFYSDQGEHKIPVWPFPLMATAFALYDGVFRHLNVGDYFNRDFGLKHIHRRTFIKLSLATAAFFGLKAGAAKLHSSNDQLLDTLKDQSSQIIGQMQKATPEENFRLFFIYSLNEVQQMIAEIKWKLPGVPSAVRDHSVLTALGKLETEIRLFDQFFSQTFIDEQHDIQVPEGLDFLARNVGATERLIGQSGMENALRGGYPSMVPILTLLGLGVSAAVMELVNYRSA